MVNIKKIALNCSPFHACFVICTLKSLRMKAHSPLCNRVIWPFSSITISPEYTYTNTCESVSYTHLTRTAAIDYAAKNIRINAVCPGVIRTPMAEDLMRRDPSLEKELVRNIPAGRLGKPEEIANAVLWLCSPQASFVDGHALLVDGAFSIH